MEQPKMRFKREDGTSYSGWVNNTFSETFSTLNNNTFSRDMLSDDGTVCNIHYGDILVKFGEVCDIQTADTPKVNANIDTDKYDKLKDGDIIIADTAEDETVGKAIEIYHVGANEVVSGLHTMACRPNRKFAPKYLGYYINSPSYHNQLIPFMQGIKVTSIGRKNITDTIIHYPPSLEEQQKITDFLSSVDEIIAQSEAEVQNLEQQKKGAMQKIFSQEVRFRREDGTEFPEWVTKRFLDISVPCNKRNKERLNLEIYSINNQVGFIPQEEQFEDAGYLNDTDTSIYMIVPPNHFAYNPARINVGSIGYQNVGYDVQVSSLYEVFATTSECDDGFIWHWFHTPLFNKMVMKYGEGGVRVYYYYDKLCETPIMLPCLEEQQKIADFLSAYDDAISYAKQELDKWKELKKGLLQQMFV